MIRDREGRIAQSIAVQAHHRQCRGASDQRFCRDQQAVDGRRRAAVVGSQTREHGGAEDRVAWVRQLLDPVPAVRPGLLAEGKDGFELDFSMVVTDRPPGAPPHPGVGVAQVRDQGADVTDPLVL